MKNKLILGSVVGLSSLLLLTGCGSSSKNLTCTAEFEEEGHKYTGEIVAELDDNDKVKDVSMTMGFDNKEDATQMYSSYQMIISFAKSMAEQSGEEFPEIDIKQDGKKVIISNYAALDKLNSGEEEQETLIGMSKEDFQKKVEAQEEAKWTCK